MTNKKSTKRALLMSVLSLFLCVAMLAGTTFAWFTDSVSSKNNIIKAGNLDIELEYKKVENGKLSDNWEIVGGRDDIFDRNAYWEPGRVEVVYLKVSNLGSLALKYQLGVNVVNDNPGTNVDGDTFYLSEHLVFKTVLIEEKDVGTYTRATAVEDGDTLGFKDYNGKTTALEVGGADYVAMIVYMPETVGNVANHKKSDDPLNPAKYAASIEFGINLLATQYSVEDDSYGNDYDDDAWVDGFKVTTANDLQSALNNGETKIVLENDIAADKTIVVPAGGNVAMNLNGKTITGTKGRDADNNRIHVIVNNGILTIKDGTVKSADFDGGSAIYNNAGATLTIEDVTLYGAPQSDPVYEAGVSKPFPSYAVNNYGNAVVNGATVKSYHGAIATGGNGVTVINDADIDVGLGQSTGITSYLIYSYDNAQVTVNDGKFAFTKQEIYVNGGNTFCELGTNPIIINGGNYTGTSFSTGEGREYVIKGGTFDAKPAAKYIAADYAAVDNGNGTWSVIFPQDSFDDLIDNANPGDTVEVPVGNFTLSGNNDLVIVGQGEDTVITFSNSIENANISNATISGEPRFAVKAGQNAVFNDVTFEGTKAWGSIQGTATFTGCTFSGLFHIDSSAETTTVRFVDCTFDEYSIIKFGGKADYVLEGCVVKALAPDDKAEIWGKKWLITYCDVTFTDCELGRDVRAGVAVNITLNGCVDANDIAVTEKIVHTNTASIITIDGIVWARTTAELQNALASGDDVVLSDDLTVTGSVVTTNGVTEAYGNKVGVAQYGGTLDGNGNTLTETGSSAYVIVTHGGTIKNLTIVGGGRGIVIYAPTEDVIIDNVVIDGPGYAINTAEHNGQNLIVTNSTVNGWTSLAGLDSVSFTNCKFGENSTKCWQNYGYDADYDRLIRPYGQASFTDCTFEKSFYIDLSALANDNMVTLTNCNCEGVVLTAENYANYITVELPNWANSIADCIVFG